MGSICVETDIPVGGVVNEHRDKDGGEIDYWAGFWLSVPLWLW